MNNKRKIIITSVGIISVLAVFAAFQTISKRKITKNIPVVSENAMLLETVAEQIDEALTQARRRPNAENIGALGMVYHSSAHYAEASRCYELASKTDETSWIWNYYNGYLNVELGNSDVVVREFTEVLRKNPEAHLARYYLGEEYKNQRNYAEAGKHLKNLAENQQIKTPANQSRKDHFPLSTYASFQLGRLYFDKGEYGVAKKTLQETIAKYKLFGPAYKLLGTVYNMEGDTVSGKKFTIRANDFISFSPPVDTLLDKITLLSRSELYLLKKIDEAEDSFHSDWALQLVNQGMKFMPDNNYVVSKAIKIYLWKNQNDNAIRLIDRHMKLFEGNYSELKATAINFHQKGLFAEEMKYLEKALEIRSDEIMVLENQSGCLYVNRKKDEAFAMMDLLIEKYPDDVDVLARITDQLFQFNEREKAMQMLAKLKRMDPSNPTATRISASLALESKDVPAATKLLVASFRGNPKDEKTVRLLGDLYKNQKMWKNYIGMYQTALENSPNNPDFLDRLGEVFITCPDTTVVDYEKGRDYLERAFTHYNCPPQILIGAGSQLAYAYAKLGDMQLANVTISQTVNIGRRLNIPATEQRRLENLHRAFQNLSN